MKHAPETPHVTVLNLLTGHFRETSGYRAFRRRGVDDWLLVYTVSGLGRFGHPAGELTARPGDWVLLKPGTLHDYGVSRRSGGGSCYGRISSRALTGGHGSIGHRCTVG